MKITADLRRITPSAYGEEAYQARLSKAYPAVAGPAGLAIPDQRQAFRSTIDPKLLSAIARAAQAAFRAETLSDEKRMAMEAALTEAIAAAYPADDMLVLRRYQLASVTSRVSVNVGRYGFIWIDLPEPVALPQAKGVATFRTNEADTGIDLPDGALPWIDGLAAAEDGRKEVELIQGWPSQFKAREGRWPRWGEITAAWPRLGAWMAQQRAGACQPQGDR